MERRLDVILDAEADTIRREVERVSSIGEQTSWDIAAEFDSRRELREANRERLEDIPNVGPERAAALRDRLHE
jgi:NAD-dependent DNA ligase